MMSLQRSILLVDDDEALRETITDLLTISGYKVLIAGSGEECLELLHQGKPDLIISDIMLPGIDGLTLYEQVSREPSSGAIPFMVMSAKAEMHQMLIERGLETVKFVAKPFDTDEFLRQIELLLQ